MPLITAKYERGSLQVLLERASMRRISGRGRQVLGEGVRDGAERIRQRAVRNVSGYPVSQDGRYFRVNTSTGALKGAIEAQWPYGDTFSARVFVNGSHTSVTQIGGYTGRPTSVGRYAAAIERGHPQIDLKKTMMGKVVPFFGARAQNAKGPYAATGLRKTSTFTLAPTPGGLGFGGSDEVVEIHSGYQSAKLNAKLAAKGKKPMTFARKRTASGGSYFLAFRKVGKKGWIIPEAQPRPFMAAAASGSRADVQRIIGGKARQLLAEG